MNRHLFIAALVLLTVGEAMACPGCEYERMLLSNWLPKVIALKVAAAVIITFRRLDPVRVCYTFLGYMFIYDCLYRYAIWFSFPGGNPVIVVFATAGLIALVIGALDIGVLFLLGRLKFYRKKKEVGLVWWHLLIYLACIWTIRYFIS